MDLKKLTAKVQGLAGKYRYALLVLFIGLALLLIPGKSAEKQETKVSSVPDTGQQIITQEALAQVLQTVQGAGKVRVLLSMATGEETVYQTNSDISMTGDSNNSKSETVIITDSQRGEAGLVRQVNPAAYRGAVVVCQGADSPAVRLAITQAVAKITGLGTDAICVLKMQ